MLSNKLSLTIYNFIKFFKKQIKGVNHNYFFFITNDKHD